MELILAIALIASIVLSISTIKGSIITLIISIPIMIQCIKFISRYKNKKSSILAVIAAWTISFSLIVVVLNLPIPKPLLIILMILSSFFVGIAFLTYQRNHLHDNPIIKTKVKKAPKSLAERMELLDKKIQEKKKNYKEFGFIGLFVKEEKKQKSEELTGLFFELGREVELDWRPKDD